MSPQLCCTTRCLSMTCWAAALQATDVLLWAWHCVGYMLSYAYQRPRSASLVDVMQAPADLMVHCLGATHCRKVGMHVDVRCDNILSACPTTRKLLVLGSAPGAANPGPKPYTYVLLRTAVHTHVTCRRSNGGSQHVQPRQITTYSPCSRLETYLDGHHHHVTN
jgi:hypothetical protein